MERERELKNVVIQRQIGSSSFSFPERGNDQKSYYYYGDSFHEYVATSDFLFEIARCDDLFVLFKTHVLIVFDKVLESKEVNSVKTLVWFWFEVFHVSFWGWETFPGQVIVREEEIARANQIEGKIELFKIRNEIVIKIKKSLKRTIFSETRFWQTFLRALKIVLI